MGVKTHCEIDPDLTRASTLASDFYFGEEVLALERERVFGGSWQLVGHTAQLPDEGSFFTTDIAGEPLIVVKGQDGKIRALSNVCRHRAGPVACDSGKQSSFQCSYHGWVYGLDGSLRSAREMERANDFPLDSMRLPSFALATWGPLIFVRIEPSGPSFEEVLEGMGEIVDSQRLETFRFAQRKTWEVGCNWKVYVDNYLEGYHIPIVHPALNKELDYDRYEVETRQWFSIQHAPLRNNTRRIQAARGEEVRYLWVWPNLLINVYPDNFSTNLILPLGPDRTITIFDWYFESPESQKPELDATVKFSDEIQIEDIEICEAVQKGLRSRTYSTGRYSPGRENGVHHFHQLFSRAMNREASKLQSSPSSELKEHEYA